MLNQANLPDTPNAISLPESAGGLSRCGLPDGRIIDLFGPVPRHASLTPSQASPMEDRKAKQTSAISSLYSTHSLESKSLQSCLESKLVLQLNGGGLTRFSGVWRRKGTPAGRQFCQLVPRGRTMKEKGYIGLPTPAARDGKDISRSTAFLAARNSHTPSLATYSLNLGIAWRAITRIYCMTMGYPLRWNDARPKDTATRLSRKSQPYSFAPSWLANNANDNQKAAA